MIPKEKLCEIIVVLFYSKNLADLSTHICATKAARFTKHLPVAFFATGKECIHVLPSYIITIVAEQESKAKAEVGVAEVSVAPVAIRYTAVPGEVVPAATTDHAVRARCRSGWVGRWRAAVIILSIPVLTPLIHIAAHVIDAKLVGLLGGDFVSRFAAVAFIPCNIVKSVAAAVLVALALASTTGCVLPLRLGGQAEVLTSQRVQLRDKLLTVVP